MIEILGKQYQVRYTQSALGSQNNGDVDTEKNIITIDDRLCDEQRVSTILHEVIEVINYELELGLAHNAINALESALYPLVRSKIKELVCDEQEVVG